VRLKTANSWSSTAT